MLCTGERAFSFQTKVSLRWGGGEVLFVAYLLYVCFRQNSLPCFIILLCLSFALPPPDFWFSFGFVLSLSLCPRRDV